jgi:hypothetical protein
MKKKLSILQQFTTCRPGERKSESLAEHDDMLADCNLHGCCIHPQI